jgi:peroxiredoxin
MADGSAMARRYALPYPSIYDEDKTEYSALAPQMAYAVPGTVVIDARGRVAATVIGQVNEAELFAYLQKLAAEAS